MPDWLAPRLPLRFDQWMDAALYDPAHGFYTAGAGGAGRGRDFLTSPEVGPLFGTVIAGVIDEVWRSVGMPDRFVVLEVGAGPGTLARAVLSARPQCSDALDYRTVEVSAAQRQRQPAEVTALGAMPIDPLGAGIVLANELLDNLVVRLLEPGGEVWVTSDGPELRPTELALPEHGRLPVARAASAWVEEACSLLTVGRVIVADYGVADSAEFAARDHIVRTFRDHERGDDPFIEVGLRDITVEVPFDQLPPPTTLERQHDWLVRNGIEALVEEGRATWHERAHIGDLAALRARSRISEAEALLDRSGLGAFYVAEYHLER